MRKLCEWKGVEIIEGEICPDHVHLLVSIPPKMSVAGFMGYLKGKSSLMIFQKWGEHEVCIPQSRVLVQGILCRHCHLFLWILSNSNKSSITMPFSILIGRIFYATINILKDGFEKNEMCADFVDKLICIAEKANCFFRFFKIKSTSSLALLYELNRSAMVSGYR